MSRGNRLAALAATAVGLVLAIGMAVQPVASAATLLADDFEDGTADGWTRSGGSWSVVTDGSRAYQQSGTSSDARALVGGAWADQAVRVRVKPNGFNGSGRHVAVLARAQNTSGYYYLALSNTGSVVLGKRSGGGFTGEEPGEPDRGGTVEEPRGYYDYTLDDPNNVATIVMAGAGVGKI